MDPKQRTLFPGFAARLPATPRSNLFSVPSDLGWRFK
jgi:hypothetical protein